MDNGNFQGKKNPDGSPDLKKPLTARDAWHKKIYGEESGAEAASDASQTVYYGKAPAPQNRRKKSVMLFCCILAGVLVLAGIVAAFGGAGSGYEDENISGAASVRVHI